MDNKKQDKQNIIKDLIDDMHERGESVKLKEPGMIFLRRGQAEHFCNLQPIYYDEAGMWWYWDKNEIKWRHGDEIDILNLVFKTINLDCVEFKPRNEILQALMQVSRQRKPKVPEKYWLQFKDKICDIKNGTIFDATPEYFITNPILWKLGDNFDTPEMDKLFREWVVGEGQNESYVNILYEIIAYCACSEQFLQTIIALTGSGSNGKGTFLKLLTKFIGEDNTCSSNLKALSKRNFESSALYKKLFCNIGEVDYADLQNTAMIKQLTGEDIIRYEFKGRTPFSDYSPTTLIIATNALPKTPDMSIGFYRRWTILDFPNQFPVKADVLTRIPDIEYEHLALKISIKLKELYERGTFSLAQDFQEKQRRYEERSNPMQKFLEENYEEVPGEMIILRDFANDFNEYLKSKHLRIMSIHQIGKVLREDGWMVGRRHVGEHSVVAILNLIKN